ncbi:Legume-like lectin family protein [Tritrichomonas foetus]|uniref:Legume-like lectin family protein n=1 Tax=Tritrichomonas foetus TaxID=1144522 RepID=A0A1J4JCD2_9EUKA|nr:Legume-like lectin family protein [Tritrichomonas foetus]|eukprot:OHS96800.1 Legume-like lectin family protein [Tritrichomonas foetus]
MIFYSFLLFIGCSTSADLTPPFILNRNSTIGLWELSGAAQLIDQNDILLAPPIQFSHGGVWTNVEIPKHDFKINIKFQIQEGTGGGGLGFWLIQQFGDSGTLNGGPNVFNGISLLATVRNDGTELHFHLIQDEQKNKFSKDFLPMSEYSLQIDSKTNISLTIHVNDGNIIILVNDQEIIDDEILGNLNDKFLGITGQSEGLTSRIDLYSVEFLLDDDEKMDNSRKVKASFKKGRNGRISDDKKLLHFIPEFEYALRNPLFVATIEEIDKVHDKFDENLESSFSKVMSIIEESHFVSYEISSFKELNEFVSKTLLPYTQKWHKRTIKIVEDSSKMRNAISTTWEYTNGMIKSFNASIKQNTLKTKIKIIDLEDILENELETKENHENDFDDITKSPITMILLSVTCIELSAVLLLLIYMNCPKLKMK